MAEWVMELADIWRHQCRLRMKLQRYDRTYSSLLQRKPATRFHSQAYNTGYCSHQWAVWAVLVWAVLVWAVLVWAVLVWAVLVWAVWAVWGVWAVWAVVPCTSRSLLWAAVGTTANLALSLSLVRPLYLWGMRR
jgi:hypothetical protein